MVWIHAPGPANAALLFGANGPFQKSDPKVRGALPMIAPGPLCFGISTLQYEVRGP